MAHLIKQTLSVWQGADGQIAEIVHDGVSDDKNAIERWSEVDLLLEPRKEIKVDILLDDNTRLTLGVDAIPYIFPDRKAVLVIFGDKSPEDLTLDYFPPPHNAAVYNADGSLRFQLQNPLGEGYSFFFGA